MEVSGEKVMGGVNKNFRNKKKIEKALPDMPDSFTSYDMAFVTGISPIRCGMLLKQFEEVENIGREDGMRQTTWRKVI